MSGLSDGNFGRPIRGRAACRHEMTALEDAARGYVYARARCAGTDAASMMQHVKELDAAWFVLVEAVDPELLDMFGAV